MTKSESSIVAKDVERERALEKLEICMLSCRGIIKKNPPITLGYFFRCI